MESVKSFNAELSSLYEFKPPISKAKMTALTRGAIKAIKFYKHVVQSVEKFILKCKSEYKIPGLYVIDSIVRQSRHQFGTEKDVFAPRFAKNIQQTFVNLYKCPPEDKSKIIRVLNLWQKNQVFPPDVIQPLFDLADPNNPIYKEFDTPAQTNGHNLNALPKGSPALQKTPTKTSQSNESQQGAVNLNLTDPNVLLQLQQLQRLITRSGETKNDSQVHFDKKLLDFDYGDEEEEVNPSPKPPIQNDNPVTSLLTNPEVLRQLQTLQQTMVIAQEADADKMRKLQEMKQQEEEFDKHLAQTVPNLPFAAECEFKPANPPLPTQGYYLPPPDLTQQQQQQQMVYKAQYDLNQQTDQSNYANTSNDNDDVEVITLDHADSSRSPSPDRRRRRSRSRSRENRRDRDRRSRRSRSRSHSRSKRHRTRSRDRDRDRKDKEKETEREKERKKRGLPAMKKENLSVCSTTLWVGHLSKLVHQDDLSNTFGEFGEIVSIDLIPPRGCAFIVMNRRQDAARCLSKLKNHVIHAKAITLAWAPGKGVKGKDLKDYWEGDLGVSYIPWSKIKRDIDLDMLEDGGMIDEDTMPDWMKAKVENSSKHQNSAMSMPDMTVLPTTVDTSQPPPIPGAGLLQPPPMSLPLVPQFQFNNRLLAPPNMLNLPPGMIPNVPMGVPPPNLQNQLMSNQLLGINSPFQGTLIPPPPISLSSDNSQNTPENTMKNLTDSLMSLSQSFNMLNPQHQLPPPTTNIMQEESMDIEMEDARAHMEVHPPSSINHDPRTNSDRDRNRDERERERRENRDRDRDRDRDNKNDRNRDRDRRRSKSREREREREKERDRNRERDRDRRANSRDRGERERDRDRDNVRGRDRRDRGRSNRWGDRDKDSDPQTDRRDRERSLNERLQEMAGGGPRSSRDRKDASTSQSKFQQPPPQLNEPVFQNRLDNLNDQKTEKSLITDIVDDNLRSIEELGPNPNSQATSLDFIPGPNATMNEYHTPGAAPIQDFVPPDMPMDGPIDGFPPINDFGPAPGSDFQRTMGPGPMRPGPVDDFQGPMGFGPMGPMGPGGPINPMDEFPPMGPRGPGMDEFPPMGPRGPRDNFGPPMMDEFGPPMEGYEDDFPPHVRGRRGRMHDDRYGRRGRRDFRGGGPPRGPRGPPVPPEFFDEFGHPRDEFGPPIEEFGQPMDDFGEPMNDFGPPIDDFGPPMDDFGPARDNFRPPIEDFPPDGEFDEFAPRERFPPRGRMRGGPRDFMPRMRGGPPRGFPRGPRGRGGTWNDRNFNPRFDGPPEFFRGGRPPRDMFEDGPPRRRGGRFDGDHRPPYHVEEEGAEMPPEEFRSNRKSRWGNQSPHGFRNDVDDGPPGDEQHGADQDAEQNNGGLTPVRDEGPTEVNEAPSENQAEEVLAESGGGSDGVEEKQSEVAAAE